MGVKMKKTRIGERINANTFMIMMWGCLTMMAIELAHNNNLRFWIMSFLAIGSLCGWIIEMTK